ILNNIKKIIFILVALSIVSSLFYLGFKNENKAASDVSNKELSLKEAINLGLDRAKKWNENASLSRVSSVDEKMGGSRGGTGKRYKWHLNFMVPGTNKALLLGISKGEISTFQEYEEPNDGGYLKLDIIKFDSPHLLKIAKQKYALQKGVDWATGYQFTLSRDNNGKPTVTIFGLDKDNLFTRINLDPKNGKITSAIHKVPNGGGLIKVRLGTNKSEISKKSMAIKGILAKNDGLVTWGDRKPRVFNSAVQPFIEVSNNHGKSWTPLDFNENIQNAWVSDNELYAATKLGIWHIGTSENKTKRILTLKRKIEKIDYSQNNNMAVLSNNYIYTTTDSGKKWDKIFLPEPIISLLISDGGNLILFTNDRKLLLKKADKWDTLKMTASEVAVSDIKVVGDNLFLATNNSLLVYNLKNNRWNKIKINEQIIQLIKKRNNLFGISENGAIYLIKLVGGDANGWIAERLFEGTEGIVTDLEVAQNDFFIGTQPDYFWEPMN
ncbi:hypothetical protein, partial [Neobacillus drentensis]|uniref:hypothetical protein n=1 Tax=Neobacillus drentensis TaxID=220684 RepID=UPI002FFDCFEC